MNVRIQNIRVICILVMLGLLFTACRPEVAPGLSNGEVEPTETPTTVVIPGATTAPRVTLDVSSNPTLGSFLTDQSGFTLYTWKKDTVGVSNCTGACLQTWPAVMTSGAPAAGAPAMKGMVGVINRPDGGQQVTYNGLPLYYYIKDAIPGDVFGEGVTNDWYVVTP